MYLLKLILRNALRHRLRTALTVLGLVVAFLSFGLLQTVVGAWYSGAEGAAPNRLITRNAVSLVVPMPRHYRDKIKSVEGVKSVAAANWFAGVYQDPRNFFPQFAIDAVPYFAMYPEYRVGDDEFRAFLRDRKGAIVGRKLAQNFGFKVGDAVPLRGTIFPGNWEFVVRGIYDGVEARTDTSQFFFHWDYLNESVKTRFPLRANQVGVFVLDIADAERAAEVSETVDALFRNSPAETLTETEQAFQIGFVKQTEAIVIAIRLVSFVVIFIILAVMANTMAMTARERMSEYATLKALGFRRGAVLWAFLFEAILLGGVGGVAGIALASLMQWVQISTLNWQSFAELAFTFTLTPQIAASSMGFALLMGVVGGFLPAVRAARLSIVDALRAL